MSNKKVLVCNYTATCNGQGNCLKCVWLTRIKIVDLEELPPEKCEDNVCLCD